MNKEVRTEMELEESCPCYNCSVWHSICNGGYGYSSNDKPVDCEYYLNWILETGTLVDHLDSDKESNNE